MGVAKSPFQLFYLNNSLPLSRLSIVKDFLGAMQLLFRGQNEQLLLQEKLLFLFFAVLLITMAIMTRTTAQTNKTGIIICIILSIFIINTSFKMFFAIMRVSHC